MNFLRRRAVKAEGLESLDAIGLRHGTDKASDRNKFLNFYAQFFDSIRHRPMRILEIGVLNGASTRMWRDYFHNGHVIGVDINVAARKHIGERLSIHIADQSKEVDLAKIAKKLGPFDLIVDDGSHVWDHQILTFKRLMPYVCQAASTCSKTSIRAMESTWRTTSNRILSASAPQNICRS
jgi:hypothetical protein